MRLYIETKGTQGCRMGGSKMLGNPHVPCGFEWPFCEFDGETFDLTFLCQINCAEVNAFAPELHLPRQGMLYFFYDLDTMPDVSDTKSARVVYYDGEAQCLSEMLLTDEYGDGISFCEQEIIFSRTYKEGTPMHMLTDEHDADGNLLVLQIDAFETAEASINFCGDYTLNFYINPEGLMKQDLSGICVKRVKK